MAKPTVEADQIAQVEAVDDLPGIGADLFLAEHDLNPAGAVDEINEDEAAGAPQEHDPARDTDGGAAGEVGRGIERGASSANFSDRRGAVVPLAPGIEPQGPELLELVAAGLFERRLRGGGNGWRA